MIAASIILLSKKLSVFSKKGMFSYLFLYSTFESATAAKMAFSILFSCNFLA